MPKAKMTGRTKDNPWKLKTPSGQSEHEAFRDETLYPPALVVKVGKTELRYHLRCITDWMLLDSADEQKPVMAVK